LNKDLSIISRAEYLHAEEKLKFSGADKVLVPAQIAGRRMASMLINPEVANFLDVFVDSWDLDLTLQEIRIRKECDIDGVYNKDSKVPRELKIIGIKDRLGMMEVNPGGDFLLSAGHVMIILGE
jgi:voltage-gated potassium channel